MGNQGEAHTATVKLLLKLVDEDSLPRSRIFNDDCIEVSRLRGIGDLIPHADEPGDVERMMDAAGRRTIDAYNSYHLAAGAQVVDYLLGGLFGNSAVNSPRAPQCQPQQKTSQQLEPSRGLQKRS
jgi:hypothetical protein